MANRRVSSKQRLDLVEAAFREWLAGILDAEEFEVLMNVALHGKLEPKEK